RVLAAARQTSGYHGLIIHLDADYPSPQRALRERFQPGYDRVRQAYEARERVCEQLIPLIPVQMIEAWMLADPEALRMEIGTKISPEALRLPVRANQVESNPDPKQTLRHVLQLSLADRPQRRRRIPVNSIYEPLARQISLERLAAVPAYQQFER